jgi:rhodanese-related sulfurtransferase
MRQVSREELQGLLSRGASLLEVLPTEEYEKIHIEGAESLPLEKLDRQSVTHLDRGRAVVTYCEDFQ